MKLALDHVVLEVRDVEASLAFYRAVLGLAPVRLAQWRRGEAPFASGRVTGETIVDFFPPAMWRERRRAANPNHLCFTLSRAAVAALRRRLARRGIPIERESPRNYGARGWGVSLYFRDPDGVELEARYYDARPPARRPVRPPARRPARSPARRTGKAPARRA
jgi:catechol 2,3-dioxygenase-like lactoylglutathione lyase family enzyme